MVLRSVLIWTRKAAFRAGFWMFLSFPLSRKILCLLFSPNSFTSKNGVRQTDSVLRLIPSTDGYFSEKTNPEASIVAFSWSSGPRGCAVSLLLLTMLTLPHPELLSVAHRSGTASTEIQPPSWRHLQGHEEMVSPMPVPFTVSTTKQAISVFDCKDCHSCFLPHWPDTALGKKKWSRTSLPMWWFGLVFLNLGALDLEGKKNTTADL